MRTLDYSAGIHSKYYISVQKKHIRFTIVLHTEKKQQQRYLKLYTEVQQVIRMCRFQIMTLAKLTNKCDN
jgi:hypothetical protein